MDEELVSNLARNHDVLLIIEEGSIGGFAAHVLQCLERRALLQIGAKVRTMMLPDAFIDHDTPKRMYDVARLNAPDIVTEALSALGQAEPVKEPKLA